MNNNNQSTATQMQFHQDSNSWKVLAPAKINLNLHVGPLRGDGFHPVDSIIVKIAFHDELVFQPTKNIGIVFSTDGIECCDDADNLALRAAELIAESRDVGGIKIHLKKNIKPGRGLGGGSSDAAAVLLALNEIWQLRMSIDELSAIASQLGSDVPVFLGPNASRVTGRGEICTPVKVHPFWIVLITAPLHCPTGLIYKQYDQNPVELADQLDMEVLQAPPSRWQHMLKNDLTNPAHAVCPQLGTLQNDLNASLGGIVKMTGSGSALFTIHDTPSQAAQTLANLPQQVRNYSMVVASSPW